MTKWIEDRANTLLEAHLQGVQRMPIASARSASTTHRHDYISTYVGDLKNVIDMETIKASQLKLGIDPLGGSGIAYWQPIADRYGMNIEIVNPTVDPTFRFMPLDWDGKIRMDCSSPYAMANLIALKDRFDVAFGNDADNDRHGSVTRTAGLIESESLSGGVDRLPLCQSPSLEVRCRDRQDLGQVVSSIESPSGSHGSWSRCRSASSGL